MSRKWSTRIDIRQADRTRLIRRSWPELSNIFYFRTRVVFWNAVEFTVPSVLTSYGVLEPETFSTMVDKLLVLSYSLCLTLISVQSKSEKLI